MIAEDLAPLFADFGVPASAGGAEAVVLLDMPSQDVLGGEQQSSEYAITYRAGYLPGLKSSDSITVDGVGYKVRKVSALDDGKLMHATLKR